MNIVHNYQIDDETFEKTIRRPWRVPGAHSFENPGDFPADDYEAALATSEPIPTDFGDLADDKRGTEGMGRTLLYAVCFVALVAGVVLAL
jgi:hypothetical protein